MKNFRLNINGKEVLGIPGQTILEVARENNIFIPTLCYDERTKIYGSCGLCMCEGEGNPKLVKACARETLDLLKDCVSDEFKGEKIIVLGPMPARVAKISEKFRYRIIIKCRNSSRFRQMISKILIKTGTDSRFSKVTVYADINPDTAM
jgi:predicted molibdopterin-dependent oxidoreductase YjgC